MRHNDAASGHGMRFFTPELYMRFNSADDGEADQANTAWETTIEEYRRHLEGIRSKLPFQVDKLAELLLHDAEILGFEQDAESSAAVLFVKQGRQIIWFSYMLWGRVHEYPAPAGWGFSKQSLHWLYDEYDLALNGCKVFNANLCIHRILLSDGRGIEIPFATLFVNAFLLPADVAGTEETK